MLAAKAIALEKNVMGHGPRARFEELWAEMEAMGRTRRPIFEGYSDDPRNTDHAWWETKVSHFHMDPELAALFNVPSQVKLGNHHVINLIWLDIDPIAEPRFADLSASHKVWVDEAYRMMEPHENARKPCPDPKWSAYLPATVPNDKISWAVEWPTYSPTHLPATCLDGPPTRPPTRDPH